jgi:hypothetical protein
MEDQPTYNKKTYQEILKQEYPTIYEGYKQIIEEQFELFSKKHLDYGMSNISAGTQLTNNEEKEFALTGLWYRLSDKVIILKNLIKMLCYLIVLFSSKKGTLLLILLV